ncbi:Zinc finger MYM-type protein 2 [Holothuria leucospilota]|uniref:Zinc finger MYM-type protein 2 n=1 Tax=Holothuria leucospilota TaxID=206669 RepID=A0A9Q0YT26_HOLLE|nr:Zinc finger MYM-type protein 2 [Holothuria leucospilota]
MAEISFDLNFDLTTLDDMETEENAARFANLAEEDLDDIGEGRNEKSTKKSTKWGVKLLKEWCQAKAYSTDFEQLDVPELASLLRRFYGEVRKQDGSPYAIKSYRGLRAAIHRHLTGAPYNRQVNILRDREFQSANNVFLGMLKKFKREGLDVSSPKPAISEGDLKAMFDSKVLSMDNPSSLLNLVWFYLEYHFCRPGREGLRSLKKSSFGFGLDDENNEYVFLKFNEATKNHPGDLQDDFQSQNRMYATNDEKCPVQAIKKYLSKLNPKCEYLFQRPKSSVLESDEVWYTNTPIGVNTLGNMMVKISEKAKLSQKYTNHSIRATTITALSNAGIETRVIMAMSGHRNENSIQSYCQDASISQKRFCSHILHETLTGKGSAHGKSQSNSLRLSLRNVRVHEGCLSTTESSNDINVTSAVRTETSNMSKLFSKCTFQNSVTVYVQNQ